ncbi:hypothetical protein ACSX1A_06290 [Pontibacter sp. MBLB2868]|uniref:hypothetical protein n=1 Tax=Pontibacter sp. MBLB2868 TaxID=3451555 RepID=UPI003F74FACA
MNAIKTVPMHHNRHKIRHKMSRRNHKFCSSLLHGLFISVVIRMNTLLEAVAGIEGMFIRAWLEEPA